MKRPVVFSVYQDKAGEWRWRAKRGGRIVAESGEGYKRRRSCQGAVGKLIEALEQHHWVVLPMKPLKSKGGKKIRQNPALLEQRRMKADWPATAEDRMARRARRIASGLSAAERADLLRRGLARARGQRTRP